MFYEGTEKRLLACIKQVNLLKLPDSFWKQLVEQAGATILSKVNNQELQAYLLSESSLFVWSNKLLLVTCGNTKLIKAALFLQKSFSKQQITTLLFQRHQALKPQLQSSSFEQDSQLLRAQFNGQQLHWRDNYQGDLFLFGEIKNSNIPTKNIYMLHGLSGQFSDLLQQGKPTKAEILDKLRLRDYFDKLSCDHHHFSPKGYSLNAICGQDYLTIHLTPEKLSTYLSIETSYTGQQCAAFLKHLDDLFAPEQSKQLSFTVIDQELEIQVS